ncbi:MAG: hypothetical protein E7321_08915 [Clostridiales bacterium]|nr:hypothetical protein [Clostridiales bacterium]
MAINKVIYGGRTLIDLTGDSVTPDKLTKDVTAHDKTGTPIVGTNTFDVDSTDATATEAETLNGMIFYARGARRIGTMKNNGAVSGTISSKFEEYTVSQGFHDGSGKVQIASTEQAKLTPENIREGVTVLGVTGTMSSSEGMKPQEKSVTPSTEEQVVLPDSGFNCLTQVTVAAIPYVESDNSAGGKTVTIG